jgi:hypothetical protein
MLIDCDLEEELRGRKGNCTTNDQSVHITFYDYEDGKERRCNSFLRHDFEKHDDHHHILIGMLLILHRYFSLAAVVPPNPQTRILFFLARNCTEDCYTVHIVINIIALGSLGKRKLIPVRSEIVSFHLIKWEAQLKVDNRVGITF